MIALYIINGLIIALVLLLFFLARQKYEGFILEYEGDFQLLFMAPVSLYVIERLQLMKRFSNQLSLIQQNIAQIYGRHQVPQYTKMFMAQIVSTILVILCGGAIFFLISGGDVLLLGIAIFIIIIIPLLLIKKLGEKAEKRKEDIVYELPELASKIALLVNAGETVQQSIISSGEMKKDNTNPLYTELKAAVEDLKNGQPFDVVMEEFSKNCGAQEVSMFTTTILLNYRRGGNELSLSLRELSKDLWEARKAISKIRGEKASSKLIFPMICIFIAVLLIIAYPALKILG